MLASHAPGIGKCKQWAGIDLEIRAGVNLDTWTGTGKEVIWSLGLELNGKVGLALI